MSDVDAIMREQAEVCRRRHVVRNEIAPSVIGIGLGAVWLFVFFVAAGRSIGELQLLVATCGCMAIMFVVSLGLCALQTTRSIRSYATACVHCDYDLAGADADADGGRVCPECGRRVLPLRARFHLTRIVQATS